MIEAKATVYICEHCKKIVSITQHGAIIHEKGYCVKNPESKRSREALKLNEVNLFDADR